MIVNITNEVFTKLKTDLTDVNVLTSYPSTTPKFPCIVFEETSNIAHMESNDSGGEKYNEISFEINIFSNTQNKVSEAKKIRDDVDAILSDYYGMTRVSSQAVPNYSDTNIYRYVIRYECVVSKNKEIYRG